MCSESFKFSDCREREFLREQRDFFNVLVAINHLDLTTRQHFLLFFASHFPETALAAQGCLAQEGSSRQDARKHCKNDCCVQLSEIIVSKVSRIFSLGGFSKYVFVIVIVSLLDRLCILNTQMSQRSQV